MAGLAVAATLFAGMFAGAAQANSASGQSACYVLDGIFDGLDKLERKCEVHPAAKSVVAFIDLPQDVVADLCVGFAKMLRDNKVRFDRGWSLTMYAPKQTSAPLATCKL